MKWSFQCVSAGSESRTRPAFMVVFDHQRYLFNCGEATGRLCNENRVKLMKVCGVFATRLHWECVGGLPGVMLTLVDGGVSKLRFYGPPGLNRFLYATRHYVQRPNLDIRAQEFSGDSDDAMSDGTIRVEPIQMQQQQQPPSRTLRADELLVQQVFGKRAPAKRARPRGDASESSADEQRPRQTAKRPQLSQHQQQPSVDRATTPSSTSSSDEGEQPMKMTTSSDVMPLPLADAAISYWIKGPTRPGKFSVERALQLGVVGPDRGRLVRGQPVTLSSGAVVHPADVLGPEEPGAELLLLDIKSEAELRWLLDGESSTLAQKLAQSQNLVLVVYVLGEPLLRSLRAGGSADAELGRLCGMMPRGTMQRYVGSGAEDAPFAFRRFLRVHERLAAIDASIFPPVGEARACFDLSGSTAVTRHGAQPLRSGMTLDVAPRLQVVRDAFVTNDGKKDSAEPMPEYVQRSLARAHKAVRAAATAGGAGASLGSKADFRVTALGTGAMMASLGRNVSATLLELPRRVSLLLDCGEGTAHQLASRYGARDARDAFYRQLRLIFISHMHADHHLGLIEVMNQRAEAAKAGEDVPELVVLGPRRLLAWLREYEHVCRLPPFQFWDNADFVGNDGAAAPEMAAAMGLTAIRTVAARHCHQSYSVVLDHAECGRVAYSGDTRPNRAFAEAGAPETQLLIHEATFEDELVAEARQKRHSTISEALGIGRRMNAKHVLLTHFSQRYPTVVQIKQEKGAVAPVLAFDLMSLRLSEFWKMQNYMKPLQQIYELNSKDDEEEESDEIS